MSEQIIQTAKMLCEKFIDKVEIGRAISTETYADCKELLGMIKKHEPKFIDTRCENCYIFLSGGCPGKYPTDELDCWQLAEDVDDKIEG